jgi:FtsP/CotA-like multicopper oxidase with cupredoxin domain
VNPINAPHSLSGAIVVRPSDPSYWPLVDRELTITLDDVLIEDGQMAPFRRSGSTFTAMGRFGNVMLTNGETEFRDKASVGEVVRIYFVNTANTRIFNVAVNGARMKLVGGDSGRYEREQFVQEVMLSPSERMIVDVHFDAPGDVRLEHRAPDHVYDLGGFSVEGVEGNTAAATFEELRVDPELASERRAFTEDLVREPDKTLSFTSSMPLLYGKDEAAASVYVCPMHPEVTDTEPSSCPKCGMKLMPADPAAVTDAAGHDHHHHEDTDDGLEWEDLMPEINRQTDPSNMIWKLIDRETGDENQRSHGHSASATESRSV